MRSQIRVTRELDIFEEECLSLMEWAGEEKRRAEVRLRSAERKIVRESRKIAALELALESWRIRRAGGESESDDEEAD